MMEEEAASRSRKKQVFPKKRFEEKFVNFDQQYDQWLRNWPDRLPFSTWQGLLYEPSSKVALLETLYEKFIWSRRW